MISQDDTVEPCGTANRNTVSQSYCAAPQPSNDRAGLIFEQYRQVPPLGAALLSLYSREWRDDSTVLRIVDIG